MKISLEYAEYLIRRYGLLNIISFLALLLALVILTLFALPKHRDLSHTHIQTLKAKQALKSRQDIFTNDEPNLMVAIFHKTLPKDNEWFISLESFFDIAFEHGIYIDEMEYKFESENLGNLSKLVISLPVEASYTEIRQFIKKLLEASPNVALDSIVLMRDDPLIKEVSAKLKFTYYFHPGI